MIYHVHLFFDTWEIAHRNGSYQNGKHVIPRQGIRPPLLCSNFFRPSISVLSHAPLFVVGDAAWLHDSLPRHELLTVWPLEMICSHIRAMIRTQMPIIYVYIRIHINMSTSSFHCHDFQRFRNLSDQRNQRTKIRAMNRAPWVCWPDWPKLPFHHLRSTGQGRLSQGLRDGG